MQAVFERHSDVAGGLSQSALMAALIEVDAPVLLSSEGASADLMFRRADANARGAVDLNECELPFHTILNLLRCQKSCYQTQVHARRKYARRSRDVPR